MSQKRGNMIENIIVGVIVALVISFRLDFECPLRDFQTTMRQLQR